MYYRDFLAELHQQLAPPTYLEIGVRSGSSLALSRARSIAVDPDFRITSELRCDLTLRRTTSDEFFADPSALDDFGNAGIGLALIDGMHLYEYALRDFINIERSSSWWTVTVLDDMLPRRVEEANRDRTTVAWTGDVYKVALALSRHRPDLRLLPVHTRPTGLLLVINQDPQSRVLADNLDAVIAEFASSDPQPVPIDVLDRHGAFDPRLLLDSGLFGLLRAARDNESDADDARREVRAFLDSKGSRLLVDWTTSTIDRPDLEPWPAKPAKPPAPPKPPPPPPPSFGRNMRRRLWHIKRALTL
jgi:hypothetical protein